MRNERFQRHCSQCRHNLNEVIEVLDLYSAISPIEMLRPVCDWSILDFLHAGSLSVLGLVRFTRKYPPVLNTWLKSLIALVCKYEKAMAG